MTINGGVRNWSAMAAIMVAVLAVSLDVTVLTVALPTLAGALQATESDLQWFSSAYALVLAAGMLPAGLLGDRYGRKRVMLTSLTLFGAGSVACAASTSPAAFIAARALLGAAGAGVVVMALSAIAALIPEDQRPRAVGLWAAANFVALPLGPVLGGWLLTYYWWGWVFLMNVPVAGLGLSAVVALIPESRSPERPRVDILGTVLFCGGLAIATYGLIEAGRQGWTSATALLALAAGVLVLLAFGLWERRLSRRPGGQPVVDLRLLATPGFTWGVTLMALGLVAAFGAFFTLPQYFQAVLGMDPQGSGLRLLPLIAGLILGAVPADSVAERIGTKLTVALGFALMAAGMGLGSLTGIGSTTVFVAAWMVVVGAGMGITLSTAGGAALREVPEEQSGVASALLQALQKLGAPFGAAILGSVLNAAYQSQLHLGGLPPAVAGVVRQSVFGGVAIAQRMHSTALLADVRGAFVHGLDVSFVVSAGIALACLLLALAFMPGQIEKTRHQAELPAPDRLSA